MDLVLPHSFSPAKEARLIHFFKEVGSNLKTWGRDALETFVKHPVQEGNVPKAALGAGAAVASTVLEAPDYFWSGVLDYNIQAPPNLVFGRIRRDTTELLKNVVGLRPIRSLVNASQLVFTDLPMDGIDIIGGFDHTGSVNTTRAATRSKTVHLMQ